MNVIKIQESILELGLFVTEIVVCNGPERMFTTFFRVILNKKMAQLPQELHELGQLKTIDQ